PTSDDCSLSKLGPRPRALAERPRGRRSARLGDTALRFRVALHVASVFSSLPLRFAPTQDQAEPWRRNSGFESCSAKCSGSPTIELQVHETNATGHFGQSRFRS